MVDHGVFMTLNQWKKYVKEKVLDSDLRCMKIKCKLYKSVDMLPIDKQGTFQWWQLAYRNPMYTKHCKMIVRLLLNVFQLGKEQRKVCSSLHTNSLAHILFSCEYTLETRTFYWKNIRHVCPIQLRNELDVMSDNKRCHFILNCMYNRYTPEWYGIYAAMADFIYNVYSSYWQEIKNL